MSTFAFPARTGRTDGARPPAITTKKARPKEVRKRRARPAELWPAWTDEIRFGVPDPEYWPAWTSEVRVAPTRKGR